MIDAGPQLHCAQYDDGANMEGRRMASLYLRGNVWWGKYRRFIGDRSRPLWKWQAVSTGVRLYEGERAEHKRSRSRVEALDFITALERRERAKADALREGLTTPQELNARERPPLSIDTAVADYLQSMGSPSQRREAEGVLTSFHDAACIATAAAFDDVAIVNSVRVFLDDAIAGGVTREWAAKQRGHIVRFGAWLEDQGVITNNHARRAKVVGGTERGRSVRARAHRALTPAEADRLTVEQVNLFTLAAGDDANGIPEIRRLFYRVRIWTGLRGSEAVQLERRDLDLGDQPTLHVRPEVAKNKLDCWLPIAPTLARELHARFAMSHPGTRLFAALPSTRFGLEWRLQKDLAAAGIDVAGVNARSFRMTFVSFLEAAGVELGLRMKLRRDKGRGSERLTNWTYSDWRVTMPILRAALVAAEAWYAAEVRRAGRSAVAS